MENRKMKYFNMADILGLPIIILIGFEGLLLEVTGGNAIIPIVFAGGVIAIILNQIAFAKEERKDIFFRGEILFLIGYLLLGFIWFRAGLVSTINGFIESYKEIHPYNYFIFSDGGKNPAVTETLFLFWLSYIIGAGITYAVNKGCRSVVWIITLLWVILIVIFNTVISPWWILLSGISLGLWIFHNRLRKKARDYSATLSGDTSNIFRIALISLIVVLCFTIISPEKEYKKPELMKSICTEAEDITDLIRYGSNSDAGLPEGKLYKTENLKRGDTPILKVKMVSPESYYLRGFIGETYRDSQWLPLDSKKTAKKCEMFYWLHKDNFYGFNQITQTAKMQDEKESNAVSVVNENGDREYLYVPYEVTSGDKIFDPKSAGDVRPQCTGLRGQREYTFSALSNQVSHYQQLANTLKEKSEEPETLPYIRDESYYNEYVYSNYLDVPEDIYSVIKNYLGDYAVEGGQSHFDYQMAKQNIMFFMTNKMEYAETIKSTKRSIDFILNFIEGTKKGYDVHFASAATMMFRYYGIPARYVEGYIITKEDADNMKPGEYMTIDETRAHAWVEYYHDGIGWLPFEVTPSYMDKMESPEQIKDISGLLGQSQKDKENLQDQHQDEEENINENDGIQNFFLKYRMTIILIGLSLLVVLLLAMFIMWIVRERRKTAERIADFDVENVAKGICNIFDYTIDLLLAWGLNPEPGCLKNQKAEIIRLMGETSGPEFDQIVLLRQEAKYSTHVMEEEQREIVRDFMNKIKGTMYGEGSFIQKLKYKYMYFL